MPSLCRRQTTGGKETDRDKEGKERDGDQTKLCVRVSDNGGKSSCAVQSGSIVKSHSYTDVRSVRSPAGSFLTELDFI